MAGLNQDHHHHQHRGDEQQQQQQQLQQQESDPIAAVRVSAAVRAAAAASAASHAGGGVNVLLRYPVVVGHEITADSPLKDWVTHDGMLKVGEVSECIVCAAGCSTWCVRLSCATLLCVCTQAGSAYMYTIHTSDAHSCRIEHAKI
jgi:hypothetical protein